MIFHANGLEEFGLEELILLKCVYYPKQSMDSTQCLSTFQWYFFLKGYNFFLFLKLINLFIYFWLCWVFVFCARAFSSCDKRGPLFIAMRGPLTIAASLVEEHRLQTRRLSSCGSRA